METKSEEQIKRALEEIYDRDFVDWDYSYDGMWANTNTDAIKEDYPFIDADLVDKVWTAPGDLYSLIDDYMEERRKREHQISSSSTQEAGKELP